MLYVAGSLGLYLLFVCIMSLIDLFSSQSKSNQRLKVKSKESYEKLRQMKAKNQEHLEIKLGLAPKIEYVKRKKDNKVTSD